MTLDVYWNRIYIEDRVAAMPDDITENFRNVRIFIKQCQLRMESSDDDYQKINVKISVYATFSINMLLVLQHTFVLQIFLSQKYNNYHYA